MPSFMLKKIVLGNFSSGPVDPMMADAIDFMVDRVRIMALGWGHLVLGIFGSPWFPTTYLSHLVYIRDVC